MIEGVVNLLKPPGMTSSDAVTDVRKLFGTRRVGHTGTLDPGASGVLPVCVGRATRLFDYLVDKRKEYVAEVRFGASTDTQDSYGAVLSRSNRRVTADELKSVLPRFTGEIDQIVPMYSAVRVGGKKLYQLARQGAEAVRISREIEVYSLNLIEQTDEDRFLIKLVCSKGTYVRSICADLGVALGVPAHMSFLLRTRTGNFSIGDSHTVAELAALGAEGRLEEAAVSIEDALGSLPEARLELSAQQLRLLVNGAEIAPRKMEAYPEETSLRVYANGLFVGIGLARGGKLHIRLNLTKGGEEA
ncbi:MAG TPA: tRNA pseudouridine(55) synthase TruB [Clostridia bacterium]|nr:tRNA pseudouridine(55) synthase TruB [Clostridia bacterium]